MKQKKFLKKKSIKDFFGSKLKLIINIFDNEDDKKKYFKEENILIQKYMQKYSKIKNELSKYIDNPDFYFPAHNIIQQTLKWNIAHKIRNDYQKKNNISYQCIIRTRCDLCIMDNDYKIIDGPTAEYKKGGIYYHNVNNKSILLNRNINNINKLFYAYDNILISNNINNLLKKFKSLSYSKPYIIENKFKFSDFPLKEENEDLKDYLNKCYNEYYESDNSMVNVFFSKGHTFGQDIEIHSRYLLENNNKHFVIDYFTATKYFKGLELI